MSEPPLPSYSRSEPPLAKYSGGVTRGTSATGDVILLESSPETSSFFTGLVPATLSVDVVPHHGVICQFTKLFEKGYFNCCKIEILVKTALKD